MTVPSGPLNLQGDPLSLLLISGIMVISVPVICSSLTSSGRLLSSLDMDFNLFRFCGTLVFFTLEYVFCDVLNLMRLAKAIELSFSFPSHRAMNKRVLNRRSLMETGESFCIVRCNR